MRRLIKSRLIWISTVCKCMSEFIWCPKLPDFTLYLHLASKNVWKRRLDGAFVDCVKQNQIFLFRGIWWLYSLIYVSNMTLFHKIDLNALYIKTCQILHKIPIEWCFKLNSCKLQNCKITAFNIATAYSCRSTALWIERPDAHWKLFCLDAR